MIHGVGISVEGGLVLIQTRYVQEKGRGLIRIADNGRGMNKTILESVRERLTSDREQREKLGLANVYKRIQLFFGENAIMEIKSREYEGTTVDIMIPVKEGDENHVEDSNC